MSGNSGSGFTPTYNRPSASDNCDGLTIITNLASPKPEVVEGIERGDILIVQISSDQGPIVAIHEGNVAGTIVSRDQIRLLNCILSGTIYEAKVLQSNNGQCQVQIRSV